MTSSEATGSIIVRHTPKGEAPKEIRDAWVGLTLPCYPIAGLIAGFETGVISNVKQPWAPRSCVIVPQAEALAILEQVHPEAAKWWKDHGFPIGKYFTFGEDEIEPIIGVERQAFIEVTDEMLGDPGR